MRNWKTIRQPIGREYEYSVFGEDERYAFRSHFMTDSGSWLAEDAADDFFHRHDGWDASWPIEFKLYDGDRCLGAFSVDVEQRPHFSAIQSEAA